jgi:hypothetical protein
MNISHQSPFLKPLPEGKTQSLAQIRIFEGYKPCSGFKAIQRLLSFERSLTGEVQTLWRQASGGIPNTK